MSPAKTLVLLRAKHANLVNHSSPSAGSVDVDSDRTPAGEDCDDRNPLSCRSAMGVCDKLDEDSAFVAQMAAAIADCRKGLTI